MMPSFSTGATTVVWFGLIALTMISSLLVVGTSASRGSTLRVYTLCYLIQVYQGGSFMFIILDFYFLGQTYIIVYVGAIAIQFLFVIMMVPGTPNLASTVPQKREALNLKNGTRGRAPKAFNSGKLAIISAILLIPGLAGLVLFEPTILAGGTGGSVVTYIQASPLSSWAEFSDIQALGYAVYAAYPLALLQIGIAQWVVLIGTVVVTARG